MTTEREYGWTQQGKATGERVGRVRNMLRKLRDAIIMPADRVPADWRLSNLDRWDGRTDPLASDPLYADVTDDDHARLRALIGAMPVQVLRDPWSDDPDRTTRRGVC